MVNGDKVNRKADSVERANQDIENTLAIWLETNNTTEWSEGL